MSSALTHWSDTGQEDGNQVHGMVSWGQDLNLARFGVTRGQCLA